MVHDTGFDELNGRFFLLNAMKFVEIESVRTTTSQTDVNNHHAMSGDKWRIKMKLVRW